MPRWPIAAALSCVGLAAIVVCVMYEAADVPLIVDNQHYFFMSERAANGVAPHVSNFDPKTMLSVLITAAGIRAGGWVGVDAVLASRLVSWLTFAAAAVLLSATIFDVTRSTRAAVVGGFTFVSLRWVGLMSAVGSRPKVFLCLFIALTVFGLNRRAWVLTGVGATAAFLTWQPALLLLPVIIVFVVADRPSGGSVRALGKILGVAIAGGLIYELYFLASGALREQLVQSLLFPLRYQSGDFAGPIVELRSLRGLWTTGYGSEVWILVAVVAWVWTVREVRRHPEERWTKAAVAVLTVVVSAFTFFDHQGRSDLLFVVPFLSLLIGFGTASLFGSLTRVKVANAITALIVVGLAGVSIANVRIDRYDHTLEDQRRTAAAVGELIEAGTSIYAVGTSHLLAMNHESNWSRFSFFFRGVDEFLMDTGRLEVVHGTRTPTFVPTRDGRLPDVVLFDRAWPPGWPAWLEDHYHRVRVEEFERQGIRVWEHRPGTFVLPPAGPG